MAVTLDLDDIQGLVARGYAGLPSACYVLLSISDAARGRAWLGSLQGAITDSSARPAGRAVQVAFTARGLGRLGLAPEIVQRFSREFTGGMTTDHRSRLLGDVGDCAPERWRWGGPSTASVDALLLLFAPDQAALGREYAAQARSIAEHGLSEIRRLDTVDLDGVEPFGFRDSISQPIVEGLSKTGSADHTVAAGEFLLGYPNEYGLYTSRPIVAKSDDPESLLPRDPSGSGQPDLGRNGSYLVFRQLAQDTVAFWRFVDAAAAASGAPGDPDASTRVAAKIVGRWPSGASLVLAPDADDASWATANDFRYVADDPHGYRCPIGAHVRRTHPRDSLDPRPGSDKSVAVGNRHRLLRRGREYGGPVPFTTEAGPVLDDDAELPDVEVGLHFLCLNANIARQFEFVQHTWIENPHFAGLHDEPDPLMSAQPDRAFRIPDRPVRRRFTGLPRFVTVRGGAYFFLPGLRALRWLATQAGQSGR
ncbi:MAG: peroxidase [Actinomycetota bacterium]|nr:peroxidase [Actinomycetota bacterium]